MPTFLASATLSGVDVILVGDPPPPEGLQRKFGPNVRFEHLPWESMLQQVRRRRLTCRCCCPRGAVEAEAEAEADTDTQLRAGLARLRETRRCSVGCA